MLYSVGNEIEWHGECRMNSMRNIEWVIKVLNEHYMMYWMIVGILNEAKQVNEGVIEKGSTRSG